MEAFLQTRDLSKAFGGLHAVNGVHLSVPKGQVRGVIGPNGAGKTTLFNLLTGFLRPTRGEVIFQGRRVDGLKPHALVARGMARTFQIVQPFYALTVRENLMVPSLCPRARERQPDQRRFIEEILDLVDLRHRANELTGNLPHGDLRRLEIARALGTCPDLLLLDEPFAGLALTEIGRLSEQIRKLRDMGVTLIVIEHHLRELMKLVDCVTVLDYGDVIVEGPPGRVVEDPRVVEAYIGRGTQTA